QKQSIFFSKFLQMELYVALLVFTPFLMLQNYLQAAIGSISRAGFEIEGHFIPFVVVIAIAVLLFILITAWKKLDWWRIVSLIIIIVLMGIGQKTSDYYFNHKFYELQHNWHYFAYGIFTYVAYRYLKSKDLSDNAIILRTYLMALGASTFDESVQVFISSRIFDISDIGKDGWGTVIGLFIVFFVVEHGKIVQNGWKIREKRLRDYPKNPLSVLVLGAMFVYLLLFNSSLFADKIYWYYTILLTFGGFLFLFAIIHLSGYRKIRNGLLICLALIIIIQGFFFLKYKDEYIVKTSRELTIYKGIPILFYDVMIFPDGNFRFVDKKTFFNSRDLNTIFSKKPDILIFATGFEGKGGRGLLESFKEWDFVFNEHTLKGMQVFTLKNEEARVLFNRLKKEGKNVLCIIHSSK
ncbi:MAG: VanZ family protein, partial [Candidatus Cloacimonetes bacterium]|nr:VanZ family protein [Candidatus Cloacimonadota bacterium]